MNELSAPTPTWTQKLGAFRAPILLLAIPMLAIAATTWPFVISAKYPGMTFANDAIMDYPAAKNIPRLVMNASVINIKAGDTVRIIYGDGIYDFEVQFRCSLTALCSLINPVRLETPDAPPKPSSLNIWEAREAAIAARETNCWGATANATRVQITVPTNYWAETLVDYGNNTWGTTGGWVSGPPQVMTVQLPQLTSACR